MGIFNWLANSIFSASTDAVSTTPPQEIPSTNINPASGLPLLGEIGGVDVAGNIYGTDHAIFSIEFEQDLSQGIFPSIDSYSNCDLSADIGGSSLFCD